MDAIYRPAYFGHLSSPSLFFTSKSTDDWRVFQEPSQSHNRAYRFMYIGFDSDRSMLVSKQGTLREPNVGKYIIWKEVTESVIKRLNLRPRLIRCTH